MNLKCLIVVGGLGILFVGYGYYFLLGNIVIFKFFLIVVVVLFLVIFGIFLFFKVIIEWLMGFYWEYVSWYYLFVNMLSVFIMMYWIKVNVWVLILIMILLVIIFVVVGVMYFLYYNIKVDVRSM